MELKVVIINLKQLRMAHGLDQEQAADRCGISPGYWNELEAGKRRGSPKKIEAIARGFGIPYYEVAIILHNTYRSANAGDDNESDDEPAAPKG
ncbi:MAG: helix-turn-helix transcriptional regulator [Candidatus Zixiibacteriota bacterium]|jgi:transcriptional regulator with XRE-family HTH domain